MRVIWQQEFLKGKGNFYLDIDASSLREAPSQGACYMGFLWLLRRAKMKGIKIPGQSSILVGDPV